MASVTMLSMSLIPPIDNTHKNYSASILFHYFLSVDFERQVSALIACPATLVGWFRDHAGYSSGLEPHHQTTSSLPCRSWLPSSLGCLPSQRFLVWDVQDIYDEFNGGVFSVRQFRIPGIRLF
jgi:hypothetical protein